jgi:hypothetical protein
VSIRHVVLFRFRQGVDWSDPRASAAAQVTADHPRYIPEILNWECGRNLTDRAVACDFALVGTFADRAAVDSYLIDPDHQRGVELWREIATWVVVDYAVD